MQAHSCTQCTVYSVHSVHGTVYSVHSAQCMGVRGGKLSQRDLTLQGIVVSLPSTQRVLLCICYLRYHNHHRCHQSGSFCFLLEPDYPCASTFKFMLQTVAAEKCQCKLFDTCGPLSRGGGVMSFKLCNAWHQHEDSDAESLFWSKLMTRTIVVLPPVVLDLF